MDMSTTVQAIPSLHPTRYSELRPLPRAGELKRQGAELQKGAHIIQELDRLGGEAEVVYRTLVLPGWLGPKHGMPDTLYGYMMGVFARIDLMSAYWRGTFRDQSVRMVSFMTTHIQPDPILFC